MSIKYDGAARRRHLLTSVHIESGVRVTCDVGYLCDSFGLPIGLSLLDLGPMYATDRRLNARAY